MSGDGAVAADGPLHADALPWVEGRVVWFDVERGWGVAEVEGVGRVLVDHADLDGEGLRALNEGERVWLVVEAEVGLGRACHVRRVRDGQR